MIFCVRELFWVFLSEEGIFCNFDGLVGILFRKSFFDLMIFFDVKFKFGCFFDDKVGIWIFIDFVFWFFNIVDGELVICFEIVVVVVKVVFGFDIIWIFVIWFLDFNISFGDLDILLLFKSICFFLIVIDFKFE